MPDVGVAAQDGHPVHSSAEKLPSMPQTTTVPLRHGARVVVVGAGRMGAQIGLEFALSGYSTVLVNRTAETSATALLTAERAAATLVDNALIDDERRSAALARLSGSWDLETSCEGASYVVESVTEDLATKVGVLRRVAYAAGPTAILTTNTSALSVSELGRASGTSAQLIGTHYLNPPTLMPLVEVVPGDSTEGAVVEAVTATLTNMGKEPLLAPDIPGFICNRLQFALLPRGRRPRHTSGGRRQHDRPGARARSRPPLVHHRAVHGDGPRRSRDVRSRREAAIPGARE